MAKAGMGAPMTASEANIDRRERLRKLALETIDLAKDPYFMKNHLGTYECKLCLTLHNNEGNYLAHTQGKRHQMNLQRRQAKEKMDCPIPPAPNKKKIVPAKTVKIGRPGYQVTKQRDSATNQRTLHFSIHYPEINEGVVPKHRIMAAYEQKKEAPDNNYQYLLFAADPYETIAFKIPRSDIDKSEGKFLAQWDSEKQVYSLQLAFKARAGAPQPPPPPR
eukprot:TRINITY_DN67740_c0_g2_i1.p2 TRINITY_DN67740_c0_g2~~TRINITY_DN67740_c0_g2_i1.p2  ORF type:complete len:220 (-),score=36.06 TRINITY_DN67740_c0_g2_i1:2448-3107(-)